MLLEFKVRNFLSINDMQVLRMRRMEDDSPMTGSDFAFIYGPNSSGKSNLIIAMDFARKMILGERTPDYIPHHDLNSNFTSDQPSYFEFVFEIDQKILSYGFEVDLLERKSAIRRNDMREKKEMLKNSIKSEWLYLLEQNSETELLSFSSDNNDSYSRNPNGLFLDGEGVSDQTIDLMSKIRLMFRNNYLIRLSDSEWDCTPVPQGIVRFLKDNLDRFDTGITDVVAQPFRNREIPINLMKRTRKENDADCQLVYIKGNSRKRHWLILKDGDDYYEIRFKHGSSYAARIDEESIGTRKMIQLLTLMASQMTMDNKGVIIIDEIECSIHALAIEEYIRTFKQEMKGAQLIFTTHQHRLLSDGCSDPEDIWFMDSITEEDDKKSELYSLMSFDGEIKHYDEMYLDGRFSAVPTFTSFTSEDEWQ